MAQPEDEKAPKSGQEVMQQIRERTRAGHVELLRDGDRLYDPRDPNLPKHLAELRGYSGAYQAQDDTAATRALASALKAVFEDMGTTLDEWTLAKDAVGAQAAAKLIHALDVRGYKIVSSQT